MSDLIAGAYRAMFCQMYEVVEPTVTLGDIIHWYAVVADAGLADSPVNRTRAYVPTGFFYEMRSPPPAASALAAARTEADRTGADWVLFPQIPTTADTAPLAEAGYVALPWFMEAQYRIRDAVDTDLRRQLGNGRYRDLLRLVRRAEEEYEYLVLDGAEVAGDPDALTAFDRLHSLNLTKYRHRFNHLSAAAIKIALDSPLQDRMRLFLCRPRRGGEPVQAVLTFLDGTGEQLTILAQGIDPAAVPSRQNLYRVSFHRIYRWGETHGVRLFSLGRGNELKKVAVGANTFHLLANHLGPVRGPAVAELHELRHRQQRAFAAVVQLLREAAEDWLRIHR